MLLEWAPSHFFVGEQNLILEAIIITVLPTLVSTAILRAIVPIMVSYDYMSYNLSTTEEICVSSIYIFDVAIMPDVGVCTPEMISQWWRQKILVSSFFLSIAS